MNTILTNVRTFPKLLTMLLSIILAYVLYRAGTFTVLPSYLHGYGYLSMFFAGMLFTFGFTTPFGIAIFIALAEEVHPLGGALIAATGASLTDITIFEFARFSLREEIDHLKTSSVITWVRSRIFHPSFSERLRKYFLWTIAGLIIASPLPDEFGVTLLGSATDIEEKRFGVLCFLFNAIGIFLILSAAQIA